MRYKDKRYNVNIQIVINILVNDLSLNDSETELYKKLSGL
jgi:hypothetical protein